MTWGSQIFIHPRKTSKIDKSVGLLGERSPQCFVSSISHGAAGFALVRLAFQFPLNRVDKTCTSCALVAASFMA